MQKRYGRIAFSTTTKYRNTYPEELKAFIYRELFSLCGDFEVVCTGGTYEFIENSLDRPSISSVNIRPLTNQEEETELRRRIMKQALKPTLFGVPGIIEIAQDLVEGHIDAVIQLVNWDEVDSRPEIKILQREANVHNIPIALDIHTAKSIIKVWVDLAKKDLAVFPLKKSLEESPLAGIKSEHKTLALIAHDNMKLDICCFIVEHARKIFDQFDYLLATGTTGKWIKKFILAAGYGQQEVDRVRCCRSGVYGGDVQIAAAVAKKLCRKIIFLQDPLTSHAHETDIRFFEQSVLLFDRAAFSADCEIEFATNIECAKAILGLIQASIPSYNNRSTKSRCFDSTISSAEVIESAWRYGAINLPLGANTGTLFVNL